jgi:somatostatin
MLSCRLQCALAALSIILALGGVTGAPSDPRLRQFLQKSLAAAAGKQVKKLPRRLLFPFLFPAAFSPSV